MLEFLKFLFKPQYNLLEIIIGCYVAIQVYLGNVEEVIIALLVALVVRLITHFKYEQN